MRWELWGGVSHRNLFYIGQRDFRGVNHIKKFPYIYTILTNIQYIWKVYALCFCCTSKNFDVFLIYFYDLPLFIEKMDTY